MKCKELITVPSLVTLCPHANFSCDRCLPRSIEVYFQSHTYITVNFTQYMLITFLNIFITNLLTTKSKELMTVPSLVTLWPLAKMFLSCLLASLFYRFISRLIPTVLTVVCRPLLVNSAHSSQLQVRRCGRGCGCLGQLSLLSLLGVRLPSLFQPGQSSVVTGR